MLPEFHSIFTTNYHVAFKIFWEQNYHFKVGQKVVPKWDSFENFSKWHRDSYFKVGQFLFQIGIKVISKWGLTVEVKSKRYHKSKLNNNT